MKTARFANVVAKCGSPENYLVLMEPPKDRTLQNAVKANRVMTVTQAAGGSKADRGEVGFKLGAGRQFLIFPKTLRAFAGSAVVGIKYDLLNSPEVRKPERAASNRTRKSVGTKLAASRKAPKAKPVAATRSNPPRAQDASRNVVAFKPDEYDEIEEVAEIKKQVRHAMAVLEEGKPVAAFNLLKRIVEK